MTTYYEYIGTEAEPNSATVAYGYRCSFGWVDPAVENILIEEGGNIVNINYSVAQGHWMNVVVNIEAMDHTSAVTAALDHANTVDPPQPGWILAKLTVGSPLYEAMMQIEATP